MAKKPKGHLRRWRIVLARKKGAELGIVEAPDVQTAIEVGAELFDYPAWRLIAEEVA